MCACGSYCPLLAPTEHAPQQYRSSQQTICDPERTVGQKIRLPATSCSLLFLVATDFTKPWNESRGKCFVQSRESNWITHANLRTKLYCTVSHPSVTYLEKLRLGDGTLLGNRSDCASGCGEHVFICASKSDQPPRSVWIR